VVNTPPADFTELYEQYAQDVFRFALYLTGNRSDAEDITAETFVRAFAAPDRIRAATVKSYLLTIGRNLFLQSLRQRGKHDPLPEDVHDPARSISQQIETKAELEATLANLQRLPDVDRAALLMRASHGLSYQDIAQALGISISSAKVKVHRARAVLIRLRAAAASSSAEASS
jgi:RNA polymerase sigma-70 factor (ECF subfamily)